MRSQSEPCAPHSLIRKWDEARFSGDQYSIGAAMPATRKPLDQLLVHPLAGCTTSIWDKELSSCDGFKNGC